MGIEEKLSEELGIGQKRSLLEYHLMEGLNRCESNRCKEVKADAKVHQSRNS